MVYLFPSRETVDAVFAAALYFDITQQPMQVDLTFRDLQGVQPYSTVLLLATLENRDTSEDHLVGTLEERAAC